MILFRNLFFLFLFIANTYSLNALTFKDGKHIDEFIGTGYIIYSLTFVLFAIYCSQKSNTGKNRFGPKPKK